MNPIYEPTGRAREYAELALNLYAGCLHGCSYCYAPAMLKRTRDTFHAASTPRKDILQELEKQLAREHSLTPDQRTILLSFTSDPYGGEHDSLTREALLLLREYRRPFAVLTKGGMRAARDFDLYDETSKFGQTIITLDEAQRCEWEPGASEIKSRVAALKLAKARCLHTWISIEPVIDAEAALQIVAELSPYVDHWKVGKVNYQQSAVDWRAFTLKVVSLFRKIGASFLLKDSLLQYFDQSEQRNLIKASTS